MASVQTVQLQHVATREDSSVQSPIAVGGRGYEGGGSCQVIEGEALIIVS